MFVEVNGARLYFDVEGAGLVPDDKQMQEKPALLLLHGGPGADHSIYKPTFSALSDVAQVIYLDHRGNGRSDACKPDTWNLAQWGDDVKGFCDALSIEKPIVLGTSFGGYVAQSYATRYPEHPGKLILMSTAAKFDFEVVFSAFERVGGANARDVAKRYWMTPTSENRAEYRRVCLPLYRATSDAAPDWVSRAIIKDDVALWFNGPENELGRMDFRSALGRIECPTLVMIGDRDPITPPEFSADIAESIPAEWVQLQTFEECGHGIVGDDENSVLRTIREFIARP